MIGNFLKLTCSVIAFGAAGTACALAVAIAGLWVIGLVGGEDQSSILQIATRLGKI